MNYLVGIILALVACGVGRAFRLDRDGAFYPTVLIVVATYYVLFAVMGSDHEGLLIESVIAAGFAVLAVSGFRHSLWLVVAALFGHGVLDFYHQALIDNPGVPPSWPGFCLAFDVTAAMVLAGLLLRRGVFLSRPCGAGFPPSPATPSRTATAHRAPVPPGA